jgi:hypothetical protein
LCAVSVILLSLNALINVDALGKAQVPGADTSCLVFLILPYGVWRRVWGESNMVHLISYSARTAQIYIQRVLRYAEQNKSDALAEHEKYSNFWLYFLQSYKLLQ